MNKQKEFQIDYSDEPLLILPLCVGAALLSGEFFKWFSGLDGGASEEMLTMMMLIYWGMILVCGGLAAWQLMRTIHVTPEGIEYRFLGQTRETVPWSAFSCAYLGRLPGGKVSEICLIPVDCGEFPVEKMERTAFLVSNYSEITRFQRTKNNLRAVGTYMDEVKHDR